MDGAEAQEVHHLQRSAAQRSKNETVFIFISYHTFELYSSGTRDTIQSARLAVYSTHVSQLASPMKIRFCWISVTIMLTYFSYVVIVHSVWTLFTLFESNVG